VSADGHLIESVACGLRHFLHDSALIENGFPERLVFEDANRFALLQNRLRRAENMIHHYDALFVEDKRGLGVRIYFDNEDRAAH
jgi:hypothetical protein